MTRYWLVWFIGWFTSFAVPETIALAVGKPQDTLSAAIWRLEQFQQGQSVWRWTAPHFLFTGAFILLTVWLIGHFGWRLWA